MNLLMIGGYAIAAILTLILIATKDMTFFALKYKVLKKKGYIPTIEVKKDKQVELTVHKPNDDNEIKKDEGEQQTKQIDGEKMYWFQPFDSRIVFTREGDREIFDPYEQGGGKGISAEIVDRIAKQSKLLGMMEGKQLMPQIRGIVILIGIGILILLGLQWFDFQNTGKILEQLARSAAPAAKTAAQTAKNVTMT